MSKLNINRNIFLEREELLRFQEFMINSNVSDAFLSNTISWGILKTGTTEPFPDFKIEVGSASGTIKMTELSKALTKEGKMIKKEAFDNLSVPATGNYYWLKIAHRYSNIEKGTCSVSVDGKVTGLNTKFTEVLRGQSTEVPVKIKFVDSSNNPNIYEVVSVVGDTNIILSGELFVVESGLQYFVVGSIPLGDNVTSQQEQGLYFYDDTEFTFVLETISETEPGGKVQDNEFWVARVKNVSGTVTVEDKRTEWWQYLISGLSNKLDKNNNLSELTDVAAARSNLGVASMAEIEDAYFNDTGWKSLTRGVAANATDFNIKIRRIGSLCVVQGTFKDGSNTAQNAIIAQIPFSDLALESGTFMKPITNIYFSCGIQVGTTKINRGMAGYIKEYADGDTALQLLVNFSGGLGNDGSTIFNINFSFYVD